MTKYLMLLTALFALVGCDEKYTEADFFNDYVKWNCNRYKECHPAPFENKYSSITDCVRYYNEKREKGYIGEICPDKITSFDPRGAQKYIDCEIEVSCSNSGFEYNEDDVNFGKNNSYCGEKYPFCVINLTWVTDQTYAGLEWSPLSENWMEWYDAIDYCKGMGGHLPNINELRKIIINCPGSTYGGACRVSDPDCLNFKDCWSDDCACYGSADSCSALGDGSIELWSSSDDTNHPAAPDAWYVRFEFGDLFRDSKLGQYHVRCVR